MSSITSVPVGRPNKTIILVGVTAGTGCLLGVGSLLLYRKLNKKTGNFVDIKYVDTKYMDLKRDLSLVQRELQNLKEVVSKLRKENEQTDFGQQNHVTFKKGSANSLDSENDNVEQFFDAEDSNSPNYVSPTSEMGLGPLEELFQSTDELLSSDNDVDRTKAYLLMKQAYQMFENDWTFLWRYARATYLYGQTFLNKDEMKRKSFCEEARTLAFKALDLNQDDAEVHKWCALTIGTLSDFVSMKQKIEDGYKFKIHIDKALELQPNDAILHHLCGRWCFGVAALTWIERRVASTLFASPPTSTYEEALREFLQAEQLKPDWVENTLYVAKCYIALNDKLNATRWLIVADNVESVVSSDDVAAKKEVQDLLEMYKT